MIKRDFYWITWSGVKSVDWRMIVFCIGFFSLFVSLGTWQLDRATEKKQLLAELDEKRNQAPIKDLNLLDESIDQVDGLPVHLQGRYIPDAIILLDNIVLAGKVGFDVLVWFEERDTDRLFLVNRGFVPMGRTRTDIPTLPAFLDEVNSLTGFIYARDYDSQPVIPLTSFDESQSNGQQTKLRISQYASPVLLAAHQPLGPSGQKKLYPYLIRLALDDPNGLPRNWITANISPEKHTGYAVQWFLMAAAVLFLFIRLVRKQHASSPPLAPSHHKMKED